MKQEQDIEFTLAIQHSYSRLRIVEHQCKRWGNNHILLSSSHSRGRESEKGKTLQSLRRCCEPESRHLPLRACGQKVRKEERLCCRLAGVQSSKRPANVCKETDSCVYRDRLMHIAQIKRRSLKGVLGCCTCCRRGTTTSISACRNSRG